MKYSISILFFVIAQVNIWAQPAPCMGYSINILEDIRNIPYDGTDIYLRNITIKKSTPDLYYDWKDVIKKDALNTEILEFSELRIPNRYCNNLIYKSETKNRFYYSYPLVDEIMIIQNGEQRMYLVFPTYNNIESKYFLGTIVDSLHKLNIKKDKGAYYLPNRYISNIEFREGVFFINDYEESFRSKSFERNNVTEFFPADDIDYHRNPRNYWNEKVYFISLFDEKKGPTYSKMFQGDYTENQAIELIVKNYPPIIKKILESSTTIIKNKEHKTQHQEDLYEIWYDLLRRNVIDNENELLQKYEFKEFSIEEIYKAYKKFQKTEFFSILESDFDLTIKYYNYFIDEKADLKEFKEFVQKNNLKFSKEQLELFIDNKK